MDLKNIKVALIGLGRMGLRHIEAINKMGMAICGLVDISPTALANALQQFNLPKAYGFTQVKDMLLSQRPDAVVIATTAPYHAEYTILCANHGVNYILCEKPMAVSLQEAMNMIEACHKASARLAINHQMMFLPQYIEIKQLIDAQSLGPLSSIIVSGSNFGLAMNASHYFEMFRFLTGEPVLTVQAWFEHDKIPNPRGVEFEDYSGYLIANNTSGCRMFIDFSAKAGHGLQVLYIFKYGQVIVDELSGFIRVINRKPEHHDLPTTRYGLPSDIQQYEIQPFEILEPTIKVWEGILENSALPDEYIGLHVMRCLIAAVESNENNNAVININQLSISKERKFKWA